MRRKLWTRFSIIFLIVGGLLLARSVWNIYEKQATADTSRLAAVRRLRELEARKTELEKELSRLSTERGIEEELREKFPVAKEGENVVVIVDEPAESASLEGSTSKPSFFDFFKNWFK